MLVIKNGRLIDAKTDIYSDILLKDGEIYAIGQDLDGDEVIDATGKVVMPAFIESHAHFREPGFPEKEDLESGSRAALKGGYSTVTLMANTNPTVDNIETYEAIMERAEEIGLVNIIQNFSVTKGLEGEELVDLDNLPEGVKFISEDGHGLQKNKETFRLFEKLASLDIGIMLHEQDEGLSEIDYRYAEDVHTLRDVYFAGQTGAHAHFCHVSTEDACRAVEIGKDLGYPVTLEVTPHHIYMTDSDYKVHPPIRKESDRHYLIQSIIDGYVDCIGTDHAPHTKADKEAGSPGLIGLETAFQIVYKVLVEEYGQDLALVSQMLSAGPARLLALNKGYLEVGRDADLVIIDLNRKETILEENIVSRSKNTPFIGESFTGVIDTTIVDGEVRYEGES